MLPIAKTILFLDNLANPILVKEIRQAVKSQFLIVVLALILLGQLVFWWLFTLPTYGDTSVSGAAAYSGMLSLFGIALGFCMPLYTGWKILAERIKGDLLYVSALSPFQIIWGKFLSSASIILIVFTTFLPFFYLTLLLGGIDMLSITYSLGIVLVGLLGSVMFTIFMLCGQVSVLLRIFLMLSTLIGLFFLAGWVGFSMSMVTSDLWSPPQERFYIFLSWIIGGPMVIGLFIVLSTCIISPASSNRAVIPRIYITAMIFVAIGIFLSIVYFNSDATWTREDYYPAFLFILYSILIISFILFFVSASGRFHYGLRMRKIIPENFIKKVLCFPFDSGAANGIAWSFCFLAFAVTGLMVLVLASSSEDGTDFAMYHLTDPSSQVSAWHWFSFFNYVCIYTWIGMVFYAALQRLKPVAWSLIALGLASGFTLVIYVSSTALEFSDDNTLLILIPLAAFSITDGIEILAVITGIFNFVFFVAVSVQTLIPQTIEYFRAKPLLMATGFQDAQLKSPEDLAVAQVPVEKPVPVSYEIPEANVVNPSPPTRDASE